MDKLIARPETISLAIAANVCTQPPKGYTNGAWGRDGVPSNHEEWKVHHAALLLTLKQLLKESKYV